MFLKVQVSEVSLFCSSVMLAFLSEAVSTWRCGEHFKIFRRSELCVPTLLSHRPWQNSKWHKRIGSTTCFKKSNFKRKRWNWSLGKASTCWRLFVYFTCFTCQILSDTCRFLDFICKVTSVTSYLTRSQIQKVYFALPRGFSSEKKHVTNHHVSKIKTIDDIGHQWSPMVTIDFLALINSGSKA